MVEKDIEASTQPVITEQVIVIDKDPSCEKKEEWEGLSKRDFLTPFFSNIDDEVFIVKNLPEEVAGALLSRYSRSTKPLRDLFFDEYVSEILSPQKNRSWDALSVEEKDRRMQERSLFVQYIKDYLVNGNVHDRLNITKGREFFRKWLIEYGDESIAEQTGFHLCVEGASQMVVNAIETQRIGLGYIEKSSRYVAFDKLDENENFQYSIPEELEDLGLKERYIEIMNKLFGFYSSISHPYLEYIKGKYPKNEDEDDRAFESSRSGKRFDDLRDILPFGTQTNVAISGNARAFEYLIRRMMSYPILEVREYGEKIYKEFLDIAPSFVERIATPKGRAQREYYKNIHFSKGNHETEEISIPDINNVSLISYDKDAEEKVVASLLFENNTEGLPYSYYLELVNGMSNEERVKILDGIFIQRGDNREAGRFFKIPRSFEMSGNYTFDIQSRGGDFRDLLRHRMTTIQRGLFTMLNGYEIDSDLQNSEFIEPLLGVFREVQEFYSILKEKDPYIAQFVVPFGFLQRWSLTMNARETCYMLELRSGSQGRESYREIVQKIWEQVKGVHPMLFKRILIDNNRYSLARRASEIKISEKLNSINNNP